MSEAHQVPDVAAENEASLRSLVRAITFSQGQFSLILVRCNYEALRARIMPRLRELCPVPIRELVLPESVKTLYTTIQAELGSQTPKALMVFGLESVSAIDQVLTSTNQVREEFRKNFPFPLILWVNDVVLQKLIQLVPDFESWATTTELAIATNDLSDFLRQKTEEIFASDAPLNLYNCWQLEAAFQNLQSRGEVLDPVLQASLAFIGGEKEYANNQLDAALTHYQRCVNIFEQIQRPDLVANPISRIAEVLRRLKAWEQLQSVAQKALTLHKKYGNIRQIAEDYGCLAEVALNQSRGDEAKEFAKQALSKNANVPPYKQDLWRFVLARSQQHLGQLTEALENLKQANPESNSQYDPQLYIYILGDLRDRYFEQHQYLKAFRIKQERSSIERQYGFQAFIGAGRLQPQRQAIDPTLAHEKQQANVAEEIAASGRQQDVDRLVERISLPKDKLTVIYGQSGVGKSSIVQGGLVPALKQKVIEARDVLPIVLPVYTDWVGTLGKHFAEAFAESGSSASLLTPLDSPETLIKQLGQNAERNLLTVLIFDQFEEFFFVYKDQTKRRQFYDFLQSCLNLPYVKVVLALREDYLHYLLELNRVTNLDIINNNILDKNIIYYLGNFTQADAKSVIETLTNRAQFNLEPALIDELVQDLAGELGEVRPIELQIVGAQLQSEKITTLAKYQQGGSKEKLVERFLDGVVKDCGPENERVAQLMLYLLTDENNTRPLKTRAELARDLATEADKLDLVLEILVKSGLVFLLPEAPADRYQLIHDYLVAVIRQQRGAELIAELEFHKKRSEELLIGQSDALSRYSEALINQNQEFDGLIEALRAGIPLKRVGGEKPATHIRVVTALQHALYQVIERNRLEGHSDRVMSVVFSPDGKTLASGSDDNTIKLWSLDGQLLNTLYGHSDRVMSIVFSPDGKTLASGSWDKTIKLWSIGGKLLNTLYGHSGGVESVVFSPDGKTLASGSWDNTIKLWSIDGQMLKTLSGHSDGVISVVFSPDGKMLASGSDDKAIQLWSIDGHLLNTLSGHSDGVISVVFSPDGKTLASGSWDNTIKLWSIDGQLLNTLFGHSDGVRSVAFSPGGKALASGSDDKTIKIWSIDGQLLNTLFGHSDTVGSVVFSRDGKTLASGSWDNTIKLWSLDDQLLNTLSGHSGGIESVVFSPDGKTLASGSNDKTIKIWSIDNQLLNTLSGHSGGVESVVFSPDGKTLASGSNDKTIKLWSIDNQLLNTLFGHSGGVISVVFSPDGKTLASGSWDNTIKLWSIDGQLLNTLFGHSDGVESVVFSPDGKTLASGSWDNTIKLWSIDGQLLNTLSGHSGGFMSVVFSPDGKTLASGSWDKTIKLWSIDGKLLNTLSGHSGGVWSVVFSPNGKTLASGSEDKTIKLWSIDGKLLNTISGHSGGVESVVFSPDGKTLASGCEDNTVILRNLNLDDLLLRGCDWVRDYLKNNPNVSESDRHLCDGIGTLNR